MWSWVPDVAVDALPSFPSQADAEAWLTEAYGELAEQGVHEVSLYEDDRLVYGPMSLATV